MGSSTDVHCFACGYDQRLLIGGGFRGELIWPISCPHCAATTTADFSESQPVCFVCKSVGFLELTDPRVSREPAKQDEFLELHEA